MSNLWLRREGREREHDLKWSGEVELRGVRNKESIEGKKSSGKRYVLECMLNQLTTIFNYSFLNSVSLLANLKFETCPFKKVKVCLEFCHFKFCGDGVNL